MESTSCMISNGLLNSSPKIQSCNKISFRTSMAFAVSTLKARKVNAALRMAGGRWRWW